MSEHSFPLFSPFPSPQQRRDGDQGFVGSVFFSAPPPFLSWVPPLRERSAADPPSFFFPSDANWRAEFGFRSTSELSFLFSLVEKTSSGVFSLFFFISFGSKREELQPPCLRLVFSPTDDEFPAQQVVEASPSSV